MIEEKENINKKKDEKEKQYEYMQKQSSKESDFFEQHYKSILKNIDEELPQSTIKLP